jgi:ABC-type amino acid transport substrate-binding protein
MGGIRMMCVDSITSVMRHRSGVIIVILGAMILAGCRPDDDTWKRIEGDGIFRVGLDPTFPPFEHDDGRVLSGLDVDLAGALAADLGLQVEFTYFGYDGLYDALAAKKVDVLISALVVIPERMRDFAYSDSYFNAGDILILPASAIGIETMDDLSGRSLAVELGARGHVEATTWARRLSDLTIQPYNSSDEALAAVVEREADAALIDAVSGRLYLMAHADLKRSAEPVTVEPYALVVRSDDETLLSKLDESLARLRRGGRLDQIIGRWLGE